MLEEEFFDSMFRFGSDFLYFRVPRAVRGRVRGDIIILSRPKIEPFQVLQNLVAMDSIWKKQNFASK